MKLPSMNDYRAALAQLIIQKDSLNAAATQLITEVDRAAVMLEKMAEAMDSENESAQEAESYGD